MQYLCTLWRNFNETSSCEWELLKRFSASGVRSEDHMCECCNGGGICSRQCGIDAQLFQYRCCNSFSYNIVNGNILFSLTTETLVMWSATSSGCVALQRNRLETTGHKHSICAITFCVLAATITWLINCQVEKSWVWLIIDYSSGPKWFVTEMTLSDEDPNMEM